MSGLHNYTVPSSFLDSGAIASSYRPLICCAVIYLLYPQHTNSSR